MERPASQNHLKAFNADTTDTSSPQQTSTVLEKLRCIFQETSSLYSGLNNENKSVSMHSGVNLFINRKQSQDLPDLELVPLFCEISHI